MVDSTKLSDWLQVIGLFGVIIGLAFVGLQMRQDQKIALSNAYQARTETAISFLLANAENSVLLRAQSKSAKDGSESLTAEELLSLRYVTLAALLNYENVHFQYVNGFIGEEHWGRTKAVIAASLSQGPTREVYQSNTARWRGSFRGFLDELIAEIDKST